MNLKIKCAADEFAKELWNPNLVRGDELQDCLNDFTAGASYMLKEVLELLRSEDAHKRYKSSFNMPPFSTEVGADLTPKQWADWLEKKIGEKG